MVHQQYTTSITSITKQNVTHNRNTTLYNAMNNTKCVRITTALNNFIQTIEQHVQYVCNGKVDLKNKRPKNISRIHILQKSAASSRLLYPVV